jgi:hypothetical protein
LPVVGAAVAQPVATPFAVTYQPDASVLAAAGGDLTRIAAAVWTPSGWAPVPCAPSASGLVCAMTHAAPLQPVLISPADPLADMGLTAGHFYRQTNPFGGAPGYAVVDDAAAALWTDYQRLGGPDALGFPISNRFVDGTTPVTQVFQNGVLEWRADLGRSVAVDVLDVLSARGFDAWLDQAKQIPPAGGPIALDGQPELQATADRVKDMLGMPLAVKDYGSVVTVRFQRGALQLRKATDSAPASVVLIGSGALVREAGLVPDAALAPVPPPM